MNIHDWDILAAWVAHPGAKLRAVAAATGYSLGMVSQAHGRLAGAGYLDDGNRPAPAALRRLDAQRPKGAVILAAGFGLRMMPIHSEVPKGLLKVRGEVLIERLIRQLQAAGIRRIAVVVGFMKERYEYLTGRFGAELVVNPHYARQNNITSLKLVEHLLDNCYVLPCDVWCGQNPFSQDELYPWYMVRTDTDPESPVRVNRKRELVAARPNEAGNAMVGVAYLDRDAAAEVRQGMARVLARRDGAREFWEQALMQKDRMPLAARVVSKEQVWEINTYEELREADEASDHLNSAILARMAGALGAEAGEITDVTVMKKGMTNRSFSFVCRGARYIMRLPGEGTGKMINRAQEYTVYQAIAPYGLSDRVVWMDPGTGYKLTEYIEGVRCCDADDAADVAACMKKLRAFHQMDLKVGHTFDMYRQMMLYESYWDGAASVYDDYADTLAAVQALRPYVEAAPKDWCLTHIDAVPDNFLFTRGPSGGEQITLIDWEYAGMQDPHVDIAMFAIYAMYPKDKVEALIDAYFTEGCPAATRTKLYCYIAICGMLWSNWCEYKRLLGVEFGEYSLRQYRYAREYSALAMERIEQEAQAG